MWAGWSYLLTLLSTCGAWLRACQRKALPRWHVRDVDRKVSYLPKKTNILREVAVGESATCVLMWQPSVYTLISYLAWSQSYKNTQLTQGKHWTQHRQWSQEAVLKEGKRREIQLEMNLEEVRREPQQRSYSRLLNTVEHLLWFGLRFSRWCRMSLLKSMELWRKMHDSDPKHTAGAVRAHLEIKTQSGTASAVDRTATLLKQCGNILQEKC